MSWLDRFQKKPGGFDPELLRRLDAFAFTNASVRLGQVEANRIILAPNVNAEGVIEGDRGSVHFRLEPLKRRGDTWTLLGAIDDATSYLRFLMDLQVPAREPLGDGPLDPEHAPGFALTFRRHPEYEHGALARMACATSWRMQLDEASLAAGPRAPLESGTVVMGARLSHGPATYDAPGSGTWYLLKCSAPGPFFVGFDRATGEAEMFPRRFDADGNQFAFEVLRTIT